MTTEFEIKNCKDTKKALKGLVQDAEKGLTCNTKEHYQKHLDLLEKEYERWQDQYPEFFI